MNVNNKRKYMRHDISWSSRHKSHVIHEFLYFCLYLFFLNLVTLLKDWMSDRLTMCVLHSCFLFQSKSFGRNNSSLGDFCCEGSWGVTDSSRGMHFYGSSITRLAMRVNISQMTPGFKSRGIALNWIKRGNSRNDRTSFRREPVIGG